MIKPSTMQHQQPIQIDPSVFDRYSTKSPSPTPELRNNVQEYLALAVMRCEKYLMIGGKMPSIAYLQDAIPVIYYRIWVNGCCLPPDQDYRWHKMVSVVEAANQEQKNLIAKRAEDAKRQKQEEIRKEQEARLKQEEEREKEKQTIHKRMEEAYNHAAEQYPRFSEAWYNALGNYRVFQEDRAAFVQRVNSSL
jgi:hypothetical protein